MHDAKKAWCDDEVEQLARTLDENLAVQAKSAAEPAMPQAKASAKLAVPPLDDAARTSIREKRMRLIALEEFKAPGFAAQFTNLKRSRTM